MPLNTDIGLVICHLRLRITWPFWISLHDKHMICCTSYNFTKECGIFFIFAAISFWPTTNVIKSLGVSSKLNPNFVSISFKIISTLRLMTKTWHSKNFRKVAISFGFYGHVDDADDCCCWLVPSPSEVCHHYDVINITMSPVFLDLQPLKDWSSLYETIFIFPKIDVQSGILWWSRRRLRWVYARYVLRICQALQVKLFAPCTFWIKFIE